MKIANVLNHVIQMKHFVGMSLKKLAMPLKFGERLDVTLLDSVSLIILHLTTWLILTSLLTVNIIPLKLLSYTYMITLLTPWAHKKLLVSAFSIYRPPLIPLTIISYSLVYLLGLAFMALH